MFKMPIDVCYNTIMGYIDVISIPWSSAMLVFSWRDILPQDAKPEDPVYCKTNSQLDI